MPWAPIRGAGSEGKAPDEGVLIATSDSRYPQAEFKPISVQMCLGSLSLPRMKRLFQVAARNFDYFSWVTLLYGAIEDDSCTVPTYELIHRI